jgi:hypothetical protein
MWWWINLIGMKYLQWYVTVLFFRFNSFGKFDLWVKTVYIGAWVSRILTAASPISGIVHPTVWLALSLYTPVILFGVTIVGAVELIIPFNSFSEMLESSIRTFVYSTIDLHNSPIETFRSMSTARALAKMDVHGPVWGDADFHSCRYIRCHYGLTDTRDYPTYCQKYAKAVEIDEKVLTPYFKGLNGNLSIPGCDGFYSGKPYVAAPVAKNSVVVSAICLSVLAVATYVYEGSK